MHKLFQILNEGPSMDHEKIRVSLSWLAAGMMVAFALLTLFDFSSGSKKFVISFAALLLLFANSIFFVARKK